MKPFHKHNLIATILTLLSVTTILLSFGCSLINPGGDNNETIISSAKISGRVIKSNLSSSKQTQKTLAATDLSGNTGVANAEVWLEDLSDNPDYKTFTDASGTYVFHNVPMGEHRVIIKYVDAATGLAMKSRSNPVIVTESPEPIKIPDISGEAAKNIVTGQLRDAEGNLLTEGTALKLWGETFYVGTNGTFTSPPLPESFLEAEILVQLPGKSGAKSFTAPFASGVVPAFIELKVGTTADGNHPPAVFLSASLDGQPVSRVNPGTVVLLKARLIDSDSGHQENSTSVWSVTSGELANGSSDFEKTWTAPALYCVATVSIEVTDPKQATGKASLPILVGIENPSQIDSARPEAVVSSAVSRVQNSSPFLITISFNEPVRGFDTEDMTIENGGIDQLAVITTDRAFTARITPANPGMVSIKVKENSVQDYTGNGNLESAIFSVENIFLSSEKAILTTIYGTLKNGNLVDVAPGVKVSALKEGLTVSAGATCEILINSGGEVVPDQAATDVTSTMVVRVTAQDFSTSENTITLKSTPPVINSVAPSSASSGESITITGNNFTGATAVSFGGTAATSYTVVSATEITAIVPAGSGTNVNVTVTSPSGTSNAGLFSYPSPAISSLSPNTAAAGASITITGTNFTGATAVSFGGTAATSYTVVSATEITAIVPAGSGNNINVTVTSPSGTSNSATFNYPVPIINALNPIPAAIGAELTITGTNFTGATAVSFGTTPATSFNLVSDSIIKAIIPSGSGTNIGVTVTNPSGTSTSAAFSYSPPNITSLSPTTAAVGSSITIAGVNFTGTTAVTFGSTAATSFTLNSATQITALVPSGSGANVNVTVTSPSGTSNAATFSYPAPTLAVLAPNTAAVGATVTLTGTNFTGATAVSFGSTAATSFTVVSATQITAIVPAGSGTNVNVTVTSPSGASNAATFNYPAPTIASLAPNTAAAGASIIITGTNLTGATAVTFGSTAANTFTVNSATQITTVVPTGSGTNVNVTVTTPSGSSNTLSFNYPAPVINVLNPVSAAIGAELIITGANFTGSTAVSFGATPATSFNIISDSIIKAIIPAGSGTNIGVTVTNPSGTSTSAAFSYPPPNISSLSPATAAVGASITITGVNFTGTTAVTFGSTAATSFTVNSATQITAVVPSGSGANVNVTVTSPSGTSIAALFNYPAPTITSLAPDTAPIGATITITGTYFVGATAVNFNGTSAPSFSVVSATELTAVVPTGYGNNVNVTVTTPNGTSNVVAFNYPPPTISSLSPASAPIGAMITISGANFTNASAVTLGGTPATDYTVVSSTEIVALVPAGSGINKNVTVTTPSGISNAVAFNYPAPAISNINPSSTSIGASITITGTNFTDVSAVSFGGTAATSFTINSTTQITATVPSGSGTNVNVTVTSPSGTSNAALFNYPAPVIADVNPSLAVPGASLTIMGSNFTGTTAVSFGATPATSFTIDSTGIITAVIPSGSGTNINVTVTSPSGTSNSASFSYPPPSISSLSPATASAGASITITGVNFTGTTSVSFGGTAATSFTVNSAEEITAVVPAGAGVVNVTVTSPSGTSTPVTFSY